MYAYQLESALCILKNLDEHRCRNVVSVLCTAFNMETERWGMIVVWHFSGLSPNILTGQSSSMDKNRRFCYFQHVVTVNEDDAFNETTQDFDLEG